MSEQNLEFPVTMRNTPDISNNMSYVGDRPRSKTVAALSLQHQSGYEAKPKRASNTCPLEHPSHMVYFQVDGKLGSSLPFKR